MRDNEAKEFSSWYAKYALQRIQHHLVLPEIVKGFLQVADQVGALPCHDCNVVDVGVDVPAYLLLQAPAFFKPNGIVT